MLFKQNHHANQTNEAPKHNIFLGKMKDSFSAAKNFTRTLFFGREKIGAIENLLANGGNQYNSTLARTAEQISARKDKKIKLTAIVVSATTFVAGTIWAVLTKDPRYAFMEWATTTAGAYAVLTFTDIFRTKKRILADFEYIARKNKENLAKMQPEHQPAEQYLGMTEKEYNRALVKFGADKFQTFYYDPVCRSRHKVDI